MALHSRSRPEPSFSAARSLLLRHCVPFALPLDGADTKQRCSAGTPLRNSSLPNPSRMRYGASAAARSDQPLARLEAA